MWSGRLQDGEQEAQHLQAGADVAVVHLVRLLLRRGTRPGADETACERWRQERALKPGSPATEHLGETKPVEPPREHISV